MLKTQRTTVYNGLLTIMTGCTFAGDGRILYRLALACAWLFTRVPVVTRTAGFVLQTNFIESSGTGALLKCYQSLAHTLQEHGIPPPKYVFTDSYVCWEARNKTSAILCSAWYMSHLLTGAARRRPPSARRFPACTRKFIRALTTGLRNCQHWTTFTKASTGIKAGATSAPTS